MDLQCLLFISLYDNNNNNLKKTVLMKRFPPKSLSAIRKQNAMTNKYIKQKITINLHITINMKYTSL